MFHSFLSDDRKHDSKTHITHSKHTIELLKQRKIMSNTLSTIWGNTDGCTEHYIYETTLYLISMLSQEFYVIISRGIIAPGYGREVVHVLNAIDKSFLLQLM